MNSKNAEQSTEQSEPDAKQPALDAEQPALDAEQPALDAGQPALDAGQPALDAGQSALDAGQSALDAEQSTQITKQKDGWNWLNHVPAVLSAVLPVTSLASLVFGAMVVYRHLKNLDQLSLFAPVISNSGVLASIWAAFLLLWILFLLFFALLLCAPHCLGKALKKCSSGADLLDLFVKHVEIMILIVTFMVGVELYQKLPGKDLVVLIASVIFLLLFLYFKFWHKESKYGPTLVSTGLCILLISFYIFFSYKNNILLSGYGVDRYNVSCAVWFGCIVLYCSFYYRNNDKISRGMCVTIGSIVFVIFGIWFLSFLLFLSRYDNTWVFVLLALLYYFLNIVCAWYATTDNVNEKDALRYSAVSVFMSALILGGILLMIPSMQMSSFLLNQLGYTEEATEARWYLLDQRFVDQVLVQKKTDGQSATDEQSAIYATLGCRFSFDNQACKENLPKDRCDEKRQFDTTARDQYKNVLYGYMRWNLGDTKIFCSEKSELSFSSKENKEKIQQCLLIKGEYLHLVPEPEFKLKPA